MRPKKRWIDKRFNCSKWKNNSFPRNIETDGWWKMSFWKGWPSTTIFDGDSEPLCSFLKPENQKKCTSILQKLSECEVKAALCGNVVICLPLRFHVISNFGEFKRSKISFLTLLEVLNFDFIKFEPFLKSEIYQNSKFRVSEIVKMAIFEIQILPKLISPKIEWQIDSCIVKHSEMYTIFAF